MNAAALIPLIEESASIPYPIMYNLGNLIKLASFPTTWSAHIGMAYDGNNYIYVGVGGNSFLFYRYDIANDAWTAMANMTAPGKFVRLLYLNGKIYSLSSNSSKIYAYDIASNTWDAGTTIPTNGQDYSGIFLTYWENGAKIIYGTSYNDYKVYSFDPTTGNSTLLNVAYSTAMGSNNSTDYSSDAFIVRDILFVNSMDKFIVFDLSKNSIGYSGLPSGLSNTYGGGFAYLDGLIIVLQTATTVSGTRNQYLVFNPQDYTWHTFSTSSNIATSGNIVVADNSIFFLDSTIGFFRSPKMVDFQNIWK